ncbi:hypothetical protein [Alteromonas macleodii]|nr:hypothetical protein [Alteromonas macleodii]OES23740.1 hypothetical protein BFV93_4931 [Alteromonas macleodii]OES23953.1 hypothetical protein BFV94_4903 [Alteromonas macleodii]OES25653.1 hypothetical protein BFV95_4335 [Alteromonas macleodii]OES38935.1 hypothetical protein BFV96_4533 [Alteromonas macleodii]
MTKDRAESILREWDGIIINDKRLFCNKAHISSSPSRDEVSSEDEVTLDGGFSAEELEAIAYWLRNRNQFR